MSDLAPVTAPARRTSVRSALRPWVGTASLVLWLALSGCSGQQTPHATFQTLDGERYGPEQYKGKVVLVNFWATSCTTCVKEMPLLVSTYEKYQAKGYDTVAVAMSYDRPDYVLNFRNERKLPFRVALDLKGENATQFGGVSLTPTTFLLNKEGVVVKKWIGEPDPALLNSEIEKALGA